MAWRCSAGRCWPSASKRLAWWAGAGTLALAKIIENMEIAHNVLHGQWDWMNDPEIHSSTWEWDMVGAAKHWRITHNVAHHKYTNVLGMDDDVGYGVLRVTRDERWKPRNCPQPADQHRCWRPASSGGSACSIWRPARSWAPETRAATVVRLREFTVKAGRQLAKDFLVFPALTALSPGPVSVPPSRPTWRRM